MKKIMKNISFAKFFSKMMDNDSELFNVNLSSGSARPSPFSTPSLLLPLLRLRPGLRQLCGGDILLFSSAVVAFVVAVRIDGNCGDGMGAEDFCSALLNAIIGAWCCIIVESKYCTGGGGWDATVLVATMPNSAEEVGDMIWNAGANKTARYW